MGAAVTTLADGEVPVREGDEADSLFHVTAGRLVTSMRTSLGQVDISTVGAGHLIGEVTAMTGGRRSATVRADGAAVVSVIARREFLRWLGDHPEVGDDLAVQARHRIDASQVATMAVEVIGVTDPAVVRQIVERVEYRRLDAGASLFEQGDPSDAAHLVIAGRMLGVIRDADGLEEAVFEVGRGEVVGELGLLDRTPRSRSSCCATPSCCCTWSRPRRTRGRPPRGCRPHRPAPGPGRRPPARPR